ncbi:MAG: TIGR03936 family radical SAM-associated protein [Candidatus Omnitrophica bacterium]|nr:TIGR03936 family radical SAM-associated protein [Candidatus Omnitrophota bacterium]
MYKIKFIFAKKRQLKFISHLDLMRLFMRALRRADLPVKITEGFNPHPKISIPKALKLGLESEHEEAEFSLVEYISEQEFQDRLQCQLPDGIELKSVGACYFCG